MPDYPFTVFSGIGFLLCILPAYFSWKAPNRSWAMLFLIGWIMVLNLLFFIDSIIWRSYDMSTWWDGKIYCDINFRIKNMSSWGVPGATIGICRFLANATDPNPSQRDLQHCRFQRNMIDLFLSITLPLMIEAGLVAFETSRYHILGVLGCTGWIDYSWPSVLYYALWCPILCLIAILYACNCPSFPTHNSQASSSGIGGSVANVSRRSGRSAGLMNTSSVDSLPPFCVSSLFTYHYL